MVQGPDAIQVSDTEEMAEDKSVIPPSFTGKPAEDGDIWLRHFRNYCTYKEYGDAKSLALLKVLLTGNAALWLDTLPQATLGDLGRLTEAFKERYEIPELMRFKSAKEIFSRRQQIGESADDYAAAIRRLARIVQVDDSVTRYAILNGYLPHIAQHVLTQRPDTLEATLEAARVAELTNPIKSATEEVLTEQLADVRDEVKKLAAKWDKFTTAPVYDRQQGRPQGRSPSPVKRVTFVQSREQSPVPNPRYNGGPRGAYSTRPTFRGGGRSQLFRPRFWTPTSTYYSTPVPTPQFQTPQTFQAGQRMPNLWTQAPQCPKCGRNSHQNLNQCPAINKFCAVCGRRGHFYAVCKLAERNRQLQFQE